MAAMFLAGCILFGLVDGAPPTPVRPPFWTAGAATCPAAAADARLPDSVSLLATMRRPRRTQMTPASCSACCLGTSRPIPARPFECSSRT